MNLKTIYVKNYTTEPYGRYLSDGHGNGEEYRTEFIIPELKNGHNLIIDLDGIDDEYGSSFIVEAFANIIRVEGYSYDDFYKRITLKSMHIDWIKEIDDYLKIAQNEVSMKLLTHD
ncbi:STAS-like domain-containing protein [Aliivibrio wodanis]|uniref:STAS-like domain-containing protein n=1 Tax=Aliivibrio wodanis TaxID=80852 RepID=UPI00406CE81E